MDDLHVIAVCALAGIALAVFSLACHCCDKCLTKIDAACSV
nr:putative P6 protein [Barley yellow dwarf virus OYV]